MSVSIVGLGSLSALGHDSSDIREKYLNPASALSTMYLNKLKVIVGQIPNKSRAMVEALRQSDKKYKSLDDSVLLAILTAENAFKQSGWDNLQPVGINIGSSRGATMLFEKHHQYFLNHHQTDVLASPTTTLGNISSWVSHHLLAQGPVISHSVTCSTGLHALLNGVAWLQSGLANRFLVGGAEAPLTPFTLAQMQSLKIYSQKLTESYPCRAMEVPKNENAMVLGEGACTLALEKGISHHTLAVIAGMGYATEVLTHPVSLSAEADCLQKSMQMAIQGYENEVDVIVLHAPGTAKGDEAELRAIQKVFKDKIPALTNNKWKIGHTFGASGLLSVEMALTMLENQQWIEVPYLQKQKIPQKIQTVLINAVGFGGNAVSILLRKP